MKKFYTRQSIFTLAFLIILSNCRASDNSTPSSTPSLPPTEIMTSTPADTMTPMPTRTQEPIVFHTSQGTLEIIRYGFQPSLLEWKPDGGYRLLILWLQSVDGSYEQGDGLLEDSAGVYVIGNDRSTTFRGVCCLAPEGLVIGFTTPATASTFTLYWPGNEPIELDKPQR